MTRLTLFIFGCFLIIQLINVSSGCSTRCVGSPTSRGSGSHEVVGHCNGGGRRGSGSGQRGGRRGSGSGQRGGKRGSGSGQRGGKRGSGSGQRGGRRGGRC